MVVLASVLALASACTGGGSATVSESGDSIPGVPPAYAQPEEAAPPSTVRPTIGSIADCSPVPQSVGPPQPGPSEKLGLVAAFFEDAVSEADRSRVMQGARAAEQFVRNSLGGFRFAEPICLDVRAGSVSSTTVGVVYGANHVVLYAGSPPLVGAPAWVLPHVAAHEYIHFWQKDIGNPRENSGPTWLLEGSAELLGYQAVVAEGLTTYDETRLYSMRRLATTTPALSSMERRSPSSDEFSYPLAFLGCEFLTAGPGPGSFREYWSGLARNMTWEASFTAAFGLTPADFYLRFEEHRRRGFPR